MKNSKAATRYAKSLLDLSIEKNQLEECYADMSCVANTVSENRELELLLLSKIVKQDKKAIILSEVFKKNVSELSMSFIDIITDKGREMLLGEIAEAFVFQYKVHNKVSLAEVISAAPLGDDERKKVQEILNKLIPSGTAELKESINPNIIGGFVLKVGDQMIDSSVSTQLRDLKREFTENQYIPGF